MNIEYLKTLLNKYFDGETSLTEEQQLRDYFSSDYVDEEWKKYQPLFCYFSMQKEAKKTIESVSKHPYHHKNFIRIFTGIAACIILLMGALLLPKKTAPSHDGESIYGCTGTYVIIDGQCYEDYSLVFPHAAQMIYEINTSIENDLEVIHQQTKK